MKLLQKLLRQRTKELRPFCSVIVAAAGSSSRMGGSDKMFLPIDDIPVLARTLMALEQTEGVDEIVVAVRGEDLVRVGELCRIYGVTKGVKIICGGENRLESVYKASVECSQKAEIIAVHDGARPLAEPELIGRVIRLAARTNAAAPAVPVKDTIKVVDGDKVVSTPKRSTLRSIQTPQAFQANLLRAALQSARESGVEVTDDCSAVELLGKEIYLTEGSYQNLKITTPEDISLAELYLQQREGRA